MKDEKEKFPAVDLWITGALIRPNECISLIKKENEIFLLY
jgi:hypothetical protein